MDVLRSPYPCYSDQIIIILNCHEQYSTKRGAMIMGKEQILFKSEEKMNSKEAANLLRTIADKIEKGKVTLVQGNKQTSLKIPQRVEVEIKAEKETGRKKTTKKLEIEIEWVVGGTAQSGAVEVK
jgi:amphi-Trp domain-containing protein